MTLTTADPINLMLKIGATTFPGTALTSQGVQLSDHSKAVRWGQLRDSDPFAGNTTKQANPNYCVSIEMPVP